LLYVSELIEEHSSAAKVIGQRGIYVSFHSFSRLITSQTAQVIIVLHVVLWYTESLPLHNALFSMLSHFVYLQNFSYTWPVISLTSPSFLGSCVLVIADHFLWFFYFARITQEPRNMGMRTYRMHSPPKNVPSFAEIATFFGICVWLAPLFLFLSLSANDNALPTTAGMLTVFLLLLDNF
jgi:Transmembrane adaptor Erv26